MRGQSEKKRGPGAGPPSSFLREGDSSESIRTVSPADTSASSRTPLVRRLIRGTPTGRPTTFSSASQFSPLFPFITARRQSGWVDPREAGAAIFISLLPSFYPRPPLSPPVSPFVSPIHHLRGRSYDLHPSCLAELPLSLPL